MENHSRPKDALSGFVRSDELSAELTQWLERLKKVDAVLEAPALSLIEVSKHFLQSDASPLIPSWISQFSALDAGEERSRLVHSLVCSTLQRLWRTHRRYAWMRKETRELLENLQAKIVEHTEALIQPLAARTHADDRILTVLQDPIFGRLNPFVAAEVFWILLHAGQNRVVGATGFLCIFSMLWALMAMQSPEPVQPEDSRTLAASIAAKCLRPLLQFQVMFRRRAGLYRQIRQASKELKGLAEKSSPHARWKFACTADRLSGLMLEMSTVAINQGRFAKAATAISDIAKRIHPKESASPWSDIRHELLLTLSDLRVANETNYAEAIHIIDQVETIVLPAVAVGDRKLRTQLRQQGPDETKENYNKRMTAAARSALEYCRKGLRIMTSAVVCCLEVETDPNEIMRNELIASFLERAESQSAGESGSKKRASTRPTDADPLEWTLARLAEANDDVADLIEGAVATPVKWCRFVVRQEVAYASAGNDTEFDAADLLSAVSIAERAGTISELEVEDAIEKALRSLRPDGSWSAGQPIYLTRRVLGVWPNTTDIAWLLTGAVVGKPKIRRADAALMAFLDWLDRTRTQFDRHLEPEQDDDDVRSRLVGWSAETRESKTIDFWVTAGAINALLEMRDLIEHRLWELCEKRFFVFRELSLKPLDDVDPVDLGAIHQYRLHRRLRKTARETSGPKYRQGEYSFVFHGPPGSSKTAMAEALGREMWRETTGDQRRVLRITPADFTRQGEAGLDAEARFIFELLSHVRGVTIIFDEIDDLLSRRALKGKPAFLKMVVPAMLNRLQDLRDAAPRQEICFIVAMNYVDNVEPALTRPGRIDAAISVVYPDPWSRDNTLDRVSSEVEQLSDRMRAYVVDETAGWTWPLFNRLCEAVVAEYKKQAKKKKTPIRDDIHRIILDLGTQQQNAKTQYADELRWSPISPELVNEVAHFGMAFGRTLENCTESIKPIFDEARNAPQSVRLWTDEVIDTIKKKLASEWRREKREAYSRDAAMRAKGIMGASRVIDIGKTVFRLWCPTADEVRLAQPLDNPAKRDETRYLKEDQTALLKEEEPGVFSEAFDIREGGAYRYELTFPDGEKIEVLDPYGREVDSEVKYTKFEEPKPATSHREITSWQDLVIYQVHPLTGSEEGTYDGIAARLDKIKALGCNAIDLIGPGEDVRNSPVYNPQELRRHESAYGGTEAIRRLVQTAHEKSLSVIVGVATHDLLGQPSQDLHLFRGSYFPPANVPPVCGPQPDFEEKRVQDLMFENVRRWVDEIGADGVRWTYTTHLRSSIPPGAEREPAAPFAFLRSMNERIRSLKPTPFLVAVDLDSADLIVDRENGANFGTQWSAGFSRAVRRIITTNDNDLDELKRAITRSYYGDAFLRIIFSESHTTVRKYGRISSMLHGRPNARKGAFLATALTLVTPGIPMILQGQESWNDIPLHSDRPLDWSDGRGALYNRLRDLVQLRRNKGSGLQGHNARVTCGDRLIVVDRWIENKKEEIYEGQPGNHTIAILNFLEVGNPGHEVTFPRPGKWYVRYNSDSPVDYDDEFGNWPSGPEFMVDSSRRYRVPVGPLGIVVLSQNP
jgi:1,4-alpha-glucan branching enzyme